MRKLLIPLLAALALPTACSNGDASDKTVNANIDPKIAEMCMKAADFAGCVQTMSGGGGILSKTQKVNDKKQDLLREIKKIPSRIANTSLRDYSERTMEFTDALAISDPSEVGEKLYSDAKKLELALDLLYATWERKLDVDSMTYYDGSSGAGTWNAPKNLQAKKILDELFGINTIEVKCDPTFLYKNGQNIFSDVATFVTIVAKNISQNGNLVWEHDITKPIIKNDTGVECTGRLRGKG